MERRGLGRGLSALMSDVSLSETQTPPKADQAVPIEDIAPNPDQPRRAFAQDRLDELASSIREKGVIQPLIVRPTPEGRAKYQIVAGERRWRAAQLAQLHEVPVIVRELDDTEVLELAIVENIQRADLNAVEEAAGYRQLMDRFGHTQEKLAEALGKSRSHIANLLRLLALPDSVQSLVVEGKLSAGHARALVPLEDPVPLAHKVAKKGLSVRETERLAKAAQEGRGHAPGAAAESHPEKDADTRVLEQDLTANLGLPVSIDHRAGGQGGSVRIVYKTLDELDEICRVLSLTRAAETI